MALKDISSLKELERERHRLRQEQQQAVQGIKANVGKEYKNAKEKISTGTQQLWQGIAATEQKLGNVWAGWRWPALGSLGAILGIFLIQWLGYGEDDAAEQKSSNPTETKPTTNPTQQHFREAAIDQRLEDRIKIALAEFEAEKAEAEKPSALSTVLSIIGPLLLKELRNSDLLKQFIQPSDINHDMQAFSDKMADELEALKETL